MKLIIFIVALLSQSIFAIDFDLYKLEDSSFSKISFEQLAEDLSPNPHIILGEYHYDGDIQVAQAHIISELSKSFPMEKVFIGWEFLLSQNQSSIETIVNRYHSRNINSEELFKELFPSQDDQTENLKYLPLFDVSRKLGAKVLGLNAARSVKKYITDGGLASLPSEFAIPQMQMGSNTYYDRFEVAMGGHVPSEKLWNYFEAQCYTDSKMAYVFNQFAGTSGLRFTVVGAFHSDFNEGYVSQLHFYENYRPYTIKIVNGQKTTPEEIAKLLEKDEKYGLIADFLFVTK